MPSGSVWKSIPFNEIAQLLGRVGWKWIIPPGQPPILSEEQHHQLVAMLEQQQPADVGFEARYTWTLPLIAEWIEREFRKNMSVRGISAMLKRMNFSFTKATYTLPEQTRKRKHSSGNTRLPCSSSSLFV